MAYGARDIMPGYGKSVQHVLLRCDANTEPYGYPASLACVLQRSGLLLRYC